MIVAGLGQAVLAVSIVCYTLAIVSIILRYSASRIRGRPWKTHDTLIVLASLFGLVQIASVYYEVIEAGLGQHIVQISPQLLGLLFKGLTAQNIAWICATNTVKLSVLFFYLDIFSIRVAFRRFTYAFIGFIIVYGLSSLLCVFTICRPFQATWDTAIPGARCGNVMKAMFATAVINMLEDLVVVVMPLPIIWKLQVSRQKKIGMSAIIGAGLFICAINVARLALAAGLSSFDAPYTYAYQNLCMNLEVQIGIICACIPTAKPLFTRRKPVIQTPPPYSEYSAQAVHATIGSEMYKRFSRQSDDEMLFTTKDEKAMEIAIHR